MSFKGPGMLELWLCCHGGFGSCSKQNLERSYHLFSLTLLFCSERTGAMSNGRKGSYSVQRDDSFMSTRSQTGAETSGIGPHPETSSAPVKRDAGLSMLLFSEDKAVDDYLSNLASELMILFDKPNTIFKATDVDPVEALGQAMEVLEGAEETLGGLETRANKHVTFLQVLPTISMSGRQHLARFLDVSL